MTSPTTQMRAGRAVSICFCSFSSMRMSQHLRDRRQQRAAGPFAHQERVAAAGGARGLEVAIAIAEADAAAEIERVLVGGAQEQAGPGLAAVAAVLGRVGAVVEGAHLGLRVGGQEEL